MKNNDKTKWINTILDKLDNMENFQSIDILESCGRNA